MATSGVYDLLIVTDATYSMTRYLASLNKSLPQIIHIAALTGCFHRIGVLACRDYSSRKVTEWSGWYYVDLDTKSTQPRPRISRGTQLSFVQSLRVDYGDDGPEATKTGLSLAYEKMNANAHTIVLLHTDAPPHFQRTGGYNHVKEQRALQSALFGRSRGRFRDGVAVANAFEKPSKGSKKA